MYMRHGRRGLGDTVISGRNQATGVSTRDPAYQAPVVTPSAALTNNGLIAPGPNPVFSQYATDASAAALAKYLGGSVVKTVDFGPNAPPPTNEIVLPSGNVINAGLYQSAVTSFGPDQAARMLTAQEVSQQQAASQLASQGITPMTRASNPSVTPASDLVYSPNLTLGPQPQAPTSTQTQTQTQQQSQSQTQNQTPSPQQTSSGSYAVTNPITAPEDPYLPTSTYVPQVSSAAAPIGVAGSSIPSWAWWLAAAFGGWYLIEKA